MSKVCDICGKRKTAGNKVTFSHRGIKRSFTPNLRKVRVYDENGTPKRLNVCSRCLRSGKVNRNKPQSDYIVLDENVEEENVELNTVEEETVEESEDDIKA